MALLYIVDPTTHKTKEVGREASLPVEITNATAIPVVGKGAVSVALTVADVTIGEAYSAGSVMGSQLAFDGLLDTTIKSGVITKAMLVDIDNEGLGVDVLLFSGAVTCGADGEAVSIAPEDLPSYEGVIRFAAEDFETLGDYKIATKELNLRVTSTDGKIYAQCVAQGAINIAEGCEPTLKLVVIPD